MRNNVWIITSTWHTPWSVFTPQERWQQTMHGLQTIRDHDPHAHVIFVDNSEHELCETQLQQLYHVCDESYLMGWRKISRTFNRWGIKGAGECHMLLLGLQACAHRIPHINRIFKMSARYALCASFDVTTHEHHPHKYVFRQRGWYDSGVPFLHSRLWSTCGSLHAHMVSFVQQAFNTHLHDDVLIEQALFQHMDLTKLTEFHKLDCEGFLATTRTWIQE